MNFIRPGFDPDPKTVEVRVKALAKEGFTAASFGLDEQQLRHHLDPRNEPELFELCKIDPVGRARLWEWLSAEHKEAGEKLKGAPFRPNGHDVAGQPNKEPFFNGQVSDVAPSRFAAQPFVWRDPKTIKPRQWLHAKHYIRGFVSATIAPAGLGKSSLQLVEAAGMVAGRDLLRGTTAKKPLKVWYWNLEDPREEIDRRIAAILLHYKIHPDEINGRLFVNSGRDEPLVVAEMQRGSAVVHVPVAEALKSEITRLSIDALIIDPFVSCHRLPENDNGAIDAVVKTWAAIAEECNCSVELAHHVRKPSNGSAGADFDVNDARGASSLIGGARSARVLNVMSKDEAEATGVPEKHRRAYFRCENGKANMRPASDETDWHKFVSVGLGNETVDDPEDEIGVVTAWKRPGLFDNMAPSDLFAIQKAVVAGQWREDARSPDWVGIAVANVLGLDATAPADKTRLKGMLKVWIENKVLKVVEKPDAKRMPKRFVDVGIWAT